MNDIPWIHTKDGVKDLKLKIIASGGISIIPSLFCKCKICEERTLLKKLSSLLSEMQTGKADIILLHILLKLRGNRCII